MRDKIMDEHRSDRPTLQSLREEITRTDEEMARLFVRRMEISRRIGALKTELGLPVFDPAREEENLRKAASRVAPEWLADYRTFLQTCMDLSKACQEKQKEEES